MGDSFRLAGVIGDPVAHSRSPALHNAAFAHAGVRARYELWRTPAAELPARIESLRAPHILGANVTLPHKIAVLPLLDRVTPAAAIGAVNTIIREQDGTLSGANTDAPAVVATLREDAGFDPAGQFVVILGASGAARAAAVALASAGIAQLVILNRTLEKAENLLGDLLASLDELGMKNEEFAVEPQFFALTLDDPFAHELLAQTTLLINATSLGWHDEMPIAAELIAPGALVFDMVYRETPLLRAAAANGNRTLGGMGMLVRQAALAFEYWTGQPADIDVMRAAVNID